MTRAILDDHGRPLPGWMQDHLTQALAGPRPTVAELDKARAEPPPLALKTCAGCTSYYAVAGGVGGLIRRGLIAHTFRDNEHKYSNPGQQMPISEAYAITEAGKLVIGLLKEAGIYQHYVTAMPAEAVGQ